MADRESLTERVSAVERAVTDGAATLPEASTVADIESTVSSLEAQLADLEDRTAELEAATQALRGYVGNVRSVNTDVEQRADAALAAVDRLEDRVEAADSVPGDDEWPATGRADSDPSKREATTHHAMTDRDSKGESGILDGTGTQSSCSTDAALAETARQLADETRPEASGDEEEGDDEPGALAQIRALL